MKIEINLKIETVKNWTEWTITHYKRWQRGILVTYNRRYFFIPLSLKTVHYRISK